MALYLKTDGTIVEVKPKDGKMFKLPELHSLIGGYLELVPLRPGKYGELTIHATDVMFCDEDGKLKGKQVNVAACVVSPVYPPDVIVGDVVICRKGEID
jgi:Domain of unknown function (DUF3846)